jgi:cytochrome c biogenesis protein
MIFKQENREPYSLPVKIMRAIWSFFTSIKLGISLILVLAAISLIGVLVIQVPQDFLPGSAEYLRWLNDVAFPKYGIWVKPMEFLQLFDIFHSILFIGAGFLLVMNIVLCSIKRWRSTWVTVFVSSHAKHSKQFYTKGMNLARLYSPADQSKVRTSIIKLLRKQGYGVKVEDSSDRFYLSAIKNRFSPFGTYLSHFSLILFIIAFLITSYFGFRDSSFVVTEGSEREVGHGTMLSLCLEDFTDEYWPDGTPKDYRSEVVLYKDGDEVKHGAIRVNHPMRYQGIRFYQSYFGPATRIRVQLQDGETLYENSVALSGVLHNDQFQRPVGSFLLSTENLAVRLIGPAVNIHDPSISGGEIGLELYDENTAVPVAWAKLKKGTPVGLEGLQFTYLQESMYSGFQVSKDPGSALIWVASILFLLGICTIFYFPRRQLWAMVQQADRGSRIFMRWAPVRGPGRNLEFEILLRKLQSISHLRIENLTGAKDD